MTALTQTPALKTEELDTRPAVASILPTECPIEMPHQDLAISPVVNKMTRWVFLPGNAVRHVFSIRKRRRVQEQTHVA